VRPVTCMITDRQRLADPTPGGLATSVRAVAIRGAQLIHLRERDLDGRVLLELAGRVVEAVRGTAARVLINDRLDVALAAGAHGVHLRAVSFRASRVRTVVPAGFLIGQSVHSAEEAAALGDGADYLLFGNVFETGSKPGKPGAGIEALARVARATRLPVLAVGGVTLDVVPQLLAAGAAGFAGISLFDDGTIR
jgi:thiamine-phosphate diphosphorylase